MTQNSTWKLARDIQPLVNKVKMHPRNKMKTRSQKTCDIVRRVVKQGTRPRRKPNQTGVEKCFMGSATSLEKYADGNQEQGHLPAGPSRVTPKTKRKKDKRQKWFRGNHKKVMHAFYMSLEKPAGRHTENMFKIWRSRNHNIRMTLNGSKVADVRRDSLNKKRLTDFELRDIKKKVIADVKNSGNAGIRDGDDDDRDEGTGGVNCTDADTRVAITRYVD